MQQPREQSIKTLKTAIFQINPGSNIFLFKRQDFLCITYLTFFVEFKEHVSSESWQEKQYGIIMKLTNSRLREVTIGCYYSIGYFFVICK